jgi:mRNA interferase RelE/StbE
LRSRQKKELAKLEKQAAKRIISFLRERLSVVDDPRTIGKALKGSKLGDFWRYRVGNYRIVCSIENSILKIIVIRIAHRKNAYK